MSDSDTFVVEVRGPKGVKLVSVPAAQARFFSREHDGDEYRTALYLAQMDLYYHSLKDSE